MTKKKSNLFILFSSQYHCPFAYEIFQYLNMNENRKNKQKYVEQKFHLSGMLVCVSVNVRNEHEPILFFFIFFESFCVTD